MSIIETMRRTLDATSDDALPALYRDWIGCDPADGGDETPDDMRATLRDYVKECVAALAAWERT